jgi:hypothetical protein
LRHASQIVQTLGYLPLAIDQAAAYIAFRHLPLNLFLTHYDKRRETVLTETPLSAWVYGKSRDQASIFTTWEISLDQFSSKVKNHVSHFLTQAAFFDIIRISEDLFSSFFTDCSNNDYSPYGFMDLFISNGSWDTFKYQDLIATLANLSLVQSVDFVGSSVVFALHPLIKASPGIFIKAELTSNLGLASAKEVQNTKNRIRFRVNDDTCCTYPFSRSRNPPSYTAPGHPWAH